MPILKNQRHELFAQNLAKGMTGSAAYKFAGYVAIGNSAESSASTLQRTPKVAARVAELKERAAEKAVASREWIIDRLTENAIGHQITNPAASNKALELIGKEQHSMFTDKKDITLRMSIEDLVMKSMPKDDDVEGE